ncbi:Hypp5092 [Branchiostoma lanceolatum]|uniref:Hypp5092 protein n=1 Tax=Branchiostoma lanceolatum TaxID=7740 RepID=A0A8K0F3F3_BRALA|nr:Hypp5092 [Branchiostoma lanceolatum]
MYDSPGVKVTSKPPRQVVQVPPSGAVAALSCASQVACHRCTPSSQLPRRDVVTSTACWSLLIVLELVSGSGGNSPTWCGPPATRQTFGPPNSRMQIPYSE